MCVTCKRTQLTSSPSSPLPTTHSPNNSFHPHLHLYPHPHPHHHLNLITQEVQILAWILPKNKCQPQLNLFGHKIRKSTDDDDDVKRFSPGSVCTSSILHLKIATRLLNHLHTLHCITMHCDALWYAVVLCGILRNTVVLCTTWDTLQCTAMHLNALQRTIY